MRPLLDVVGRAWEGHQLWVIMCLRGSKEIDMSGKLNGLIITMILDVVRFHEHHASQCLGRFWA